MNSISIIQSHAQTRSIIFSAHARVRMVERGISSEDILHILTDGEIIEEYDDDTHVHPFSCLCICEESLTMWLWGAVQITSK